MRKSAVLIATAAVLAGCARQVDVVSGGEMSAGGEVVSVVPATGSILTTGTVINARLNQTLSTESSKAGDTFTATVTESIVAANGEIVVPAGAVVHGTVTALKDSDNITEQAFIQLRFDRLSSAGRTHDFSASVQNVAVQERGPTTEETLKKAGAGAAAGAVLGAVIGGASLSAIIKGGLLGAAAGTVISLGMGGVDHVIPAGTVMSIRTTQDVAMR